MPCCNYGEYNNAFDKALAQQELHDYLQTGLKKSSQPFMQVLEMLPLNNKSLLDIGGGIGAITFELFKRNIRTSTHIDLSVASVETFRSEVKRRSLNQKINSLNGDFLDLEEEIATADLVILDKVICCYEDYEQLVGRSIKKARHWYVYSIPRKKWLVRAYFLFESIRDRIRGKYLPVYFHPNSEIEKIIYAAGFNKKMEKFDGKWHIIVFQK